MNPHRSAIDHVLGLVAGSPLAHELVLRGSVAMPIWVGPQAREPKDLDWVVRPPDIMTHNHWSPYPYIDDLMRVRTAPETVHRPSRDELWAEQDHDAEGHRPHLPPDGLHWMRTADLTADEPLFRRLIDLLRDHPRTPEGLLLDADLADWTADMDRDARYGGSYDDEDYGEDPGYEGAGVRIKVPFEGGTLQIDLAYDETLPEPPVPTAVPKADGSVVPLWTAGAPLSLAWKLQWLITDQTTRHISDGKDLYDAVLLAEHPGMTLSRRLQNLPGIATLNPSDIRTWTVKHHPSLPPDPSPWRTRLAKALTPLLTKP